MRHLQIGILLLSVFALSFWLMFHTFGYDSKTGQLLIGAKAASDFASHIPQIRSFSMGVNWPPQYPLYPGERTRYHFLFYAFSGILEKFGIRLDWALNLPSALGFASLCLLIFVIFANAFSSLTVGVISLIFFLLNGSFSFLDFLNRHPLDSQILHTVVTNSTFPSFGPWDGSLISAFWNLNIYTNQRHLGLSFAVVLLMMVSLYAGRRKLIPFVGFMAGSLLFLNQAAFPLAMIFITWAFLVRRDLRIPLLISGLGGIPWLILAAVMLKFTPSIVFKPGFLLPGNITPMSFFHYWLLNFGLHLFFIPLGFIIAPRRAKVFFSVPLLLLFILPNLFQFSPDMINNHKLFNFFLIIGSGFSALAVCRIWHTGILGKVFSSIIFLFLVLGGVIDFFPIKNDYYIRVADSQSNPDVWYFANQTPKNSVVLNSTWLYHPASMAGRSIFNGYPYFTWSYGYDQTGREALTAKIYSSPDKSSACEMLAVNHISYVELSPSPESFLHPNISLWQTDFVKTYHGAASGIDVYDVKKSCPSL
jgi:hypothetical protein